MNFEAHHSIQQIRYSIDQTKGIMRRTFSAYTTPSWPPTRSPSVLVAFFISFGIHIVGASIWYFQRINHPMSLPSHSLEFSLFTPQPVMTTPKDLPHKPQRTPIPVQEKQKQLPKKISQQPTATETIEQSNIASTPEETDRPLQEVLPIDPPNFDAAYLSNPKPEYPRTAKKLGLQGTVLLHVIVNTDGKVQQISILTSSGVTALDQAAILTVQQWSFVPAHQGDQPIIGEVYVPIRFSLNEKH